MEIFGTKNDTYRAMVNMFQSFRFRMTVVVLLLMMFLAACVYHTGYSPIDRSTVSNFNLPKFMGRWYEVARFDHRFERGLHNVTADYRLQDDGSVEVVNQGDRGGVTHRSVGRAKTTRQSGRLRVSFFWIFYSDYNVMEMADDGEWVLVGSRSPQFLWILSRTPTLSESTIDHIMKLADERGYNTDNFIFDSSRVASD